MKGYYEKQNKTKTTSLYVLLIEPTKINKSLIRPIFANKSINRPQVFILLIMWLCVVGGSAITTPGFSTRLLSMTHLGIKGPLTIATPIH